MVQRGARSDNEWNRGMAAYCPRCVVMQAASDSNSIADASCSTRGTRSGSADVLLVRCRRLSIVGSVITAVQLQARLGSVARSSSSVPLIGSPVIQTVG